jgi:hypothetical protein
MLPFSIKPLLCTPLQPANRLDARALEARHSYNDRSSGAAGATSQRSYLARIKQGMGVSTDALVGAVIGTPGTHPRNRTQTAAGATSGASATSMRHSIDVGAFSRAAADVVDRQVMPFSLLQ